MKRRVVIFASSDDRDKGFEKALALADQLTPLGFDVTVSNKQGFDLKLLKLVAAHRVLYTPTVLLFERSAMIARLAHLPSVEEVQRIYSFTTQVSGADSEGTPS